MNRGNSQFMEPVSTHSRHNSSALPGAPDNLTAKDRFMDWWSHLTADIGFKWKMRNPQSINSSNDPFSSRGMSEKKAPLANKPDFLTLLNMDDGELDREAQRRRASRMKGSGSSAEHFLGGLSLNFGDDPFSDSNAIAHQSAKPAPLTVSQANNPFSDANAIPGPVVPKPSTYVADIRRSRGQSVSGPPPNSTDPRRSRGKSIGGNRPPSNTAGMGMYGRESTASVDSFATRRNKFRSDPFDLERPELLSRPNVPSSNVSTAGSSAPRFSDFEGSNSRFSNGVGMNPAAVRKPVPTHSRRESYSSKYSSGISMGDWSDPGPDVGPAANRWDSSTRSSPTEGWRNEEEQEQSTRTGNGRRQSQGSQRSVGKAL
ncbi:hypothetical protein UCRPA7_1924 [Phaeoacremonium minimum UCRPA7]|uniref:Uncharacterized protein n=1 Tax=Phaeoacremonium minimum (strain UCR-PA7) TaxID=1286976 RepID=R8BTE4_PHAM7|nr:hypothetical protein UCRPA7_1924 [Phaeoacremonium minimum UCRPA7]EOO02545.1 hypothetical protein UCRPA7_1924 [Phaeoacremonium minimum UCRPA7]